MTREEAIKRFQLMKKILSIPNSDATRTIEAIDMAIEALSEETSTIQEKHQLSEETSTNTPTKSTNISTNASAEAVSLEELDRIRTSYDQYIEQRDMAISERISDAVFRTSLQLDDAVQGCDGCRYNTRTPQERCLRCKRYWRDSYERKGGDTE